MLREQLKSQILHFDGLLCPNHVQRQLKKYRIVSLMTLNSDANFKEKRISSLKNEV